MTDEMPLVSIVVPAYNAERFLRTSLDSILNQTYPAKEVLLMDDASTDQTEEIARSYGDRIRYFRQARNLGQFGNVDDGIARARGRYVAVYHADDIYFPEIVEREVGFLETYPEAAAVFAIDIMIEADGRERGRVKLPREVPGGVPLDYATLLNALLLHKNHIFRAPSSMVRKSVYAEVGRYRGDEFPVAGDFEMFFRIARRYPVGILDQHLFKYRWGHGNADQLDRLRRTQAEPYFAIMDDHLAHGGLALARPEALAAHEAHRSEDAVMRTINCYVLNRGVPRGTVLAEASLRRILASPQVQRWRLTVLFILLHVLDRLPHSEGVARLFRKRWYGHVQEAVFENLRRSVSREWECAAHSSH